MYLSKKLSALLTNALIENEIIPESQKNLYVYSYEFLLDQLIYLSVMLLSGLLLHRFSITIIFLTAFLPMRAFGGGIHAPTETACVLLSFAFYFGVLLFAPVFAPHASGLWKTLFLTAIFVTLFLAPVDTANKRLSEKERNKKKRQYFVICLFLLALFEIFYHKKLQLYYGTLSICVILVAGILILGAISNRIEHNRSKI